MNSKSTTKTKEEDIIIPDGVVDVKQYRIYEALSHHPLLKSPFYTASNGEEYNIAMLPHRLRKEIESLPEKEQEEVMELKSRYMSLHAKHTIAKNKAFGRSYVSRVRTDPHSPFEADIIELLGRMFTVPEVIRIMGEDNGIEIDEHDVTEVLKKNIVEIEKKREAFRNKVADVRLYNKRPRLEELAWMYSKMKSRYIALNAMDSYNAMLRTLEQIRKEAEGDILTVNGVLDVNVEVQIQNHIQQEILRTINLKEVILGRVAARMNYSPAKLIAGLHNSYYAKFVDISGDFDPDAEMNYPSQSAYDFDNLKHQQHDVVDITPEEITPEAHEDAQNVRNLFLSKLRRKREELELRNTLHDIQQAQTQQAKNEDKYNRYNKRRNDEKLKSQSSSEQQWDKDYHTRYKNGWPYGQDDKARRDETKGGEEDGKKKTGKQQKK